MDEVKGLLIFERSEKLPFTWLCEIEGEGTFKIWLAPRVYAKREDGETPLHRREMLEFIARQLASMGYDAEMDWTADTLEIMRPTQEDIEYMEQMHLTQRR